MKSFCLADFYITDKDLLITVSRQTGYAYILKRSADECFEQISSSLVLSKNGGLTSIKQSKINNILFFSRFSSGILVVAKLNSSSNKIQALKIYTDFVSDLTNTIASNYNGALIFGNFKTGSRISLQKNRLKNKTFLENYQGLNITSSTLSEKNRSIFLSGTGTFFTHSNLFSRKIIFKTDIKNEENLYYTILIKNETELLIGTGHGSVISYCVKTHKIKKCIKHQELKSLTIFCMNQDIENEKVFLGGYKKYTEKTTSIYVNDITSIMKKKDLEQI